MVHVVRNGVMFVLVILVVGACEPPAFSYRGVELPGRYAACRPSAERSQEQREDTSRHFWETTCSPILEALPENRRDLRLQFLEEGCEAARRGDGQLMGLCASLIYEYDHLVYEPDLLRRLMDSSTARRRAEVIGSFCTGYTPAGFDRDRMDRQLEEMLNSRAGSERQGLQRRPCLVAGMLYLSAGTRSARDLAREYLSASCNVDFNLQACQTLSSLGGTVDPSWSQRNREDWASTERQRAADREAERELNAQRAQDRADERRQQIENDANSRRAWNQAVTQLQTNNDPTQQTSNRIVQSLVPGSPVQPVIPIATAGGPPSAPPDPTPAPTTPAPNVGSRCRPDETEVRGGSSYRGPTICCAVAPCVCVHPCFSEPPFCGTQGQQCRCNAMRACD